MQTKLSDSHCHLVMTGERIGDFRSLMQEIKNADFRFLLDIGTMADDLFPRIKKIEAAAEKSLLQMPFLYFTAGIWPETEAILNPTTPLTLLEKNIIQAQTHNIPLVALGECGIDRHWNGINGLYAKQNKTFAPPEAEENFFMAQLKLAKKYNLPVVVHSRDDFTTTLRCIDKINYHRGVIHCFSYTLKEALACIERGWYISLSGTITYAKKPQKKEIAYNFIRALPKNRLLLETDSPYLSPHPFRGKTNTPLQIFYLYQFVTDAYQISLQELSDNMYQNNCTLFNTHSNNATS